MGDVFRRPRTQQERRSWDAEFGRPGRAPRRLPTLWEDTYKSNLGDRCWKRYRATQYRALRSTADRAGPTPVERSRSGP